MKIRIAQALSLSALHAAALCALSVSAPAAPQGAVSIYIQQTDTMGSIYVYDEMEGSRFTSPVHLRDLRLLEIDFVGRTELDEFLPERPRYHADVPSASRLSLPRGQGSLYRFVASPSLRERIYGFLQVDSGGRSKIVAQLPGTGRDGTEDPWLPRVSVSPDGMSFLAATRYVAGGNLLEVALSTLPASVIDRTAHLDPLRIKRGGLGLQNSWGAAVSTQGVLRFSRGPDSLAEFLNTSPQTQIHWFQGDLVFSLNGHFAVTVAGDSSFTEHLWHFGRHGSMTRVTDQPMQISNGGFLPEERNGPYLAVSNDGRLAAWRSDTEQRELFMTRVARNPLASRVVEHVTRQEVFDETLDEIGLTRFYLPDRLSFAAGARDYVHAGLDRSDVFSASLNPGNGLEVRNVSLTSGERQPPFIEYGTLEPERTVWIPSARKIFVYDNEGNDALYAVRPGGMRAKLLLRGVRALDLMSPTPEGMLVGLRRTELAGGESQLLRLDSQLMNDPVVVMEGTSAELDFSRAAPRRDGWVTFVTTEEASQTLSRVDMTTGNIEDIAVTFSSNFGPAIGYTASGAAIFSLSGSGTTATFLWPVEGGPMVQFANPFYGDTGYLLPGI